ncbi:hypothetical protein PV04_06494 [Phialophora macrospora]|uniref:Uncharacterized protein n=1 Tax=Phialophora macrospora TaxID=1851006 RepID=A0A0D2FGN6_9EURO|nr:hypothetical protein PV04_06494 [Phialophora macrospora]
MGWAFAVRAVVRIEAMSHPREATRRCLSPTNDNLGPLLYSRHLMATTSNSTLSAGPQFDAATYWQSVVSGRRMGCLMCKLAEVMGAGDTDRAWRIPCVNKGPVGSRRDG